MAKTKQVRQYAIAEHLGISRATVSKVLAKRKDVSEETRTRVMEAARQLGYVQKKERHDAAEKRGLTLGMLVRLGQGAPTDTQPGYLNGASRAAMANDVSLMVHCLPNELDEEEFASSPALQPSAMKSGALDGVLLSGVWSEAGLQRLSKLMPAVAIAFGTQLSGIDVVEPDTPSAMRSLIDHLTSFGHKRIAFVGLCPDEYWSVERYAGYVAAMSLARLPGAEHAVLSVSASALRNSDCLDLWRSYAERVLELVASGVTAIVCSSDWAAFHLHRILSESGISIPEDVSLVGFDNYEYFTLGCPPLTSVHIPRCMLAEIAVLRLIERCRCAPAPTQRTLYRCQIVDNGTVAQPRSRPLAIAINES